MLRKNDEITVTIERFGGEMGIAHLEGMTLFVQGALPGEKVLARAQKVEKTHAFLKTLQVLSPAADRVSPPCPYYEKCGGCVCQHMTYDLSLQMKRERVQDALKRIGGIEMEVRPVIGMDDPWRYRNKTALPVGGEKSAPQIGFFAPRSHRIIDVDGCLIAREESDQVARVLREWMIKFQVEPYREDTRKGLVRHIMSRVSRAGQVMAVVVAAGPIPHERELTAMLRARVPALYSLYLNINRRGDNVILGQENRLLFGEPRLNDTLCGLRYALSPQSFFQVNPVQTEKLYQTAVDFAGLTGSELVSDLYCGAGTISLLLAKAARRVIGIEIVPQAILDAEENARLNGVANAEFHAAPSEELLPKLVSQGLRPDVIVLDPPRKGCEEAVLAAIAQAAPRRVVYVSCDPATLARDVKILCAQGYTPEACQPVDMFCWTGHVETVLALSKGEISSKPIHVEFPLEDMDMSCILNDATYKQIQDYVLEHTGLKVSCLYIAQVKAKHGIIERNCYNKPKTEEYRVPKCPPEKEKAIEDALSHFQMI